MNETKSGEIGALGGLLDGREHCFRASSAIDKICKNVVIDRKGVILASLAVTASHLRQCPSLSLAIPRYPSLSLSFGVSRPQTHVYQVKQGWALAVG
jgi:hypothetical protein